MKSARLGWITLLLALLAPARAAEPPIAFWASDPTQPGETVLVMGAHLAQCSAIAVGRLPDGSRGEPAEGQAPPCKATWSPEVIQPSEGSVKFVLPGSAAPGLFAAQLKTPSGSRVVILNRPDAWWCQGDLGAAASPGGWLRVFGRCLGPTARSGKKGPGEGRLLLRGPKTTSLPAAAECHVMKAALPSDLPVGEYQVYAHGGLGGKWGWSQPLPLRVKRSENWPAAVFNVKESGARGDGIADDTPAVAQALRKAETAGGGVVYFPRGAYRLGATLRAPPQTVLRGQGEELARLIWTNRWDQRLDAVIVGANRFGIEDLSLTFSGANHGILANTPLDSLPKWQPMTTESGDVFLRRVRMRWLRYTGHLTIAQANQIFSETARDGGFGATGFLLSLGGSNIEITDCDLYSSGNLFNLTGTKAAVLARNTFAIGRAGWANFGGTDGLICEDNRFVGADNMTRGGVSFWSKLPMRNVFFARNSIEHIHFFDAEGVTTDGNSGKYFGPIESASTASVTLPRQAGWKADELAGHTCFILGGTGQGQWRNIVSSSAATFTVDRAWDLPPAADSIIGINHTVARFLAVDNTISDAGIAWQFFGTAMECIVARNHSIRSAGFFSHAARYPEDANSPENTQPQFGIQYLENEIREGNSGSVMRGGVGYGWGASVLGVRAFPGALTGEARRQWRWPLASGLVFRGNNLRCDAKILVRASRTVDPFQPDSEPSDGPWVEDVVIEGNTIAQAKIGIEVGPRCAGIVVRNNALQDVEHPFLGEGLKAARLEGNQLPKSDEKDKTRKMR